MIMEINSQENRRYKQWLKLLTRKYRDREGLYIVEEPNLIEEALKNGAETEAVIVRAGSEKDFTQFNIDCILSPQLFDRLSSSETGRGIMAVVRKKTWTADDIGSAGRSSDVIVLDRLQDPGNLGTIIRTADGAGFGGIIVIKGTADIYSPKVVRAAAGSLFRMPVVFVEDTEQLMELLRSKDMKMAVTCFDTDNWYYDTDISHGTAIVIGNEGRGVSGELMEKADLKIKIPMFGNIDSLNASVAAAVLMYEAVRQRENLKKEV